MVSRDEQRMVSQSAMFGQLMRVTTGPGALVNFKAARSAFSEAMHEAFAAASRWQSALQVAVHAAAARQDAAAMEWTQQTREMRARLWGACSMLVDGVALVVLALMGPDPISPDESASGLTENDASLVVILHARGRFIRDRRERNGVSL